MDNDDALKIYLQKELSLPPDKGFSLEELKEKLARYVNELINNHFERLVSLLYSIDVDEGKLRNVLKEKKDEEAGGIIAGLIIERQLQKIKSAKEFQQKKDDMTSEEEKW
jgi:hypothetical protein